VIKRQVSSNICVSWLLKFVSVKVPLKEFKSNMVSYIVKFEKFG